MLHYITFCVFSANHLNVLSSVSLLLLVGVLASAQVQQEMLSAVNAERARNGRPPLCLNAKLNNAAQAHSNDMANNNFLGHTGEESRIVQRLRAFCFLQLREEFVLFVWKTGQTRFSDFFSSVF